MKLGTLLLRNAVIGLSQLESALRNQVLYGGRLGTNLIELGFVDLETLSTYLAELSGLPAATPALLDGAARGLLDKLGSDDAHRLRAIPFARLDPSRSEVAVAMVDPSDAGALGELAERLGAPVSPHVVPELRVLYYLEKLFGLPRRARFVRSGQLPTQADPPEAERRRTQPAQGIVMPPSFTLAPRRRRSTSQMPFGTTVPPAMTYGGACERIDTAANREIIGETLVDYAKGRCDALVVFIVRDRNALGWRGWAAPPAHPKVAIEDLSLPLGGASALQSAHDTGGVFLGAPPSAAKPVESALWAALGVNPEPDTVLVVPVLVKQRAVNLVYAHTHAGPPTPSLISELTDLAGRAQASYLRLIKQARGA